MTLLETLFKAAKVYRPSEPPPPEDPLTPQTFIIAEAGVNHNGYVELGYQLIDAAILAGAHAVKFQLFEAERLASRHAPLAPYQQQGDSQSGGQSAMLDSLSLSRGQMAKLAQYCRKKGILFLCTPFDEPSATFLVDELKVPALKISSGDLTAIPFLKNLGSLQVPLILSTGMATLEEVREAVEAVRENQNSLSPAEGLALLHCVSAYPAPNNSLNLRALQTLQQAFPDLTVGFSDHSLGLSPALVAVGLGAKIIEKHLTLDTQLAGPDHTSSLEPRAFKAFVQGVRDTEQALGHGRKEPHPCEASVRQVARKSLTWLGHRPAGHQVTAEDLALKRPATGMHPREWTALLNRPLKHAVTADAPVRHEDFGG